jgi:CPA1 family monovalent cation:H+ antiporter
MVFAPLWQAVEENSLVEYELAFVLLLALVTLVAIMVDKLSYRVPYTVALVVVGLVVAALPTQLEINVTRELILFVILPPLLFEGALHINWNTFRENIVPILLLAVVGVAIATFIVGALLNLMLQIPLAAAVAFGALISTTDPVAVIALFRSLGVSGRLATLVEGESLLNDGVAIVIFSLALAAGAGGSSAAIRFDIGGAIITFLVVSIGGIAVGLIASIVVNHLIIRWVDDPLIETSVSMVLAFGVFLLAERIPVTGSLHLSGILAVVAAGVYFGTVSPQHMRPTTRIAINTFWELLAFIATSIVFLLIGLRVEIRELISGQNLRYVLLAVVAVLFSRMLVVYGLGWLSTRVGHRVPLRYRHILFWGGLRGAISLALVLGLAADQFGAENVGIISQLRLMTFGVVLFTVVVQGMTVERLIKRLGLNRRQVSDIEKQRRLGRLYSSRAGLREIDQLHEQGFMAESTWRALGSVYSEEIQQRGQELQELAHHFPALDAEAAVQAREAALRAERSALLDARRRDLISDDVQQELLQEVDGRLAALQHIADRLTADNPAEPVGRHGEEAQ